MIDFLIDENGMLERVDEYTLYCHYLGFCPELKTDYRSPIRSKENQDENPSFAMFKPTRSRWRREYLWTDSGRSKSGDIYDLVQILYGFERRAQAVHKVREDFFMKGSEDRRSTIIDAPEPRLPAHYRIKYDNWKGEDIDYWNQYDIRLSTLYHFRVYPIKYYFTYDCQLTPTYPKSRGYAYNIHDRYQLYFPHSKEKKFKFRNDLCEDYVMGYEHLKYKSDTLIITKSYKDLMMLYEYGYEAISPKGESILIMQEYLDYFERRYKRILLLFDNDGKHKGEEYPYPKIEVPLASETKDPTDFRVKYGRAETILMLKQIIGQG